MANGLYDKAREAFLAGTLSWLNNTIKVVLVDSAYQVNLASHQTLADIPSSSRISFSETLTNKAATAGVADADDAPFTLVPNGTNIAAMVIFQQGASDEASKLIAYIDTATGLPLIGPGGPITLAWDNGANKIFKL